MGRNGKSRALICFVLCMIMALPIYFSSAVAVKAAEQQTIIIGTNAEYSPFEYLDDNGNITGFDYDLLEAIAKEENVKLVWKDMPFDSLMGSMEAGDVQVIAAGIGPTEDRKKSVDFSDVYYTGTQCIISRKDNPIKDFEEMSGKTVAVLEGAQSDMIASGETTDYGEVKDAKVKRFKNASSLLLVPVSSIIRQSSSTSTIFALKISATEIISPRCEASALNFTMISSLQTDSFSFSILMSTTSSSLRSCFSI